MAEADPVLMPHRPVEGTRLWPYRLTAALLILGAVVGRLVYLGWGCPLDLAPDEAHYWDWSRHLDWSYYSKGPLVAWLIRLSCDLCGPLSVAWTGGLMPAVRLPAVLCGGLLLTAVYLLTLQVYRREGLALAVVATALTLPVLTAGSSLMTIDAPFTCCWAWALVLGHKAAVGGARWAWPATGLVVAVGILAKYTMVLWLPSLALFLWTTPGLRRHLWGRDFLILLAVSALGGLPILVWNWQHDWVTVRHVFVLSGLGGRPPGQEGESFQWLGPLVYVGAQCGLLLVFWFVAWVAALWTARPAVEADPGVRYLWWCSLPTFVVFLVFSVKNGGGEVNWPVTAYLSGLVLTAAWVSRQLASPRAWYRRLVAAELVLVCGVGLALSAFLYRSDLLYPALARWLGPAGPNNPFPLRRVDPTCRLRGWRVLAAAVDEVVAELRAEGVEPVLAGTNWSLPGELGFYCAGRPQSVSLGLALDDRHSQYDLWPGPMTDPELYRGRTFVLVGVIDPEEKRVPQLFERIEPARRVPVFVAGQPVGAWPVTVCRGFRGVSLAGPPRF
jgi:4-amino-4-deoxy-L-arabinose transferase-like glycosyltransferase